MKNLFFYLFAILLIACQEKKEDIVDTNFRFADVQLKLAFAEIDQARMEESPEDRERREQRNQGPLASPRTMDADGSLQLVVSRDWTSGFFPGELWYMYEYTKDSFWKEKARQQTALIEREKYNGGTHDMGFKMYCSFGNGYRLTGDVAYREILIQSANTLITRYNETVGSIRSWDHNTDKWGFPVIIDNMMNLELLFWAARETGEQKFYDIAVQHARTTMKNHFRSDNSSYHVVDYDTITGTVVNKHTHQGYNHESAWSRGQAWGIYGYMMCYRETKLPEFLDQAKKINSYIFDNPNLPEDLIPYWDFQAPEIPNEPRDVSAATVTASALYELSMYDEENRDIHIKRANKMLENLTAHYRAKEGSDRGFLLLHSTGARTFEIDVPLVYADYYFLEALLRKQKLENEGTALL